MFTGIVQHVGRVLLAEPSTGGVRLRVDPLGWSHAPAPGDSIAVAGCCLTMIHGAAAGVLEFDVVPETLAKTTLAGWREGRRVNLEHAATPATLLGGHIVQGHVDAVGVVTSSQDGPEGWRLVVSCPADLMACMTPKGSIAIDGVSLTIASVDGGASSIVMALIPTTLERTTLGALRAGDAVNVEADVLAKTVVQYLRSFAGRGGA